MEKPELFPKQLKPYLHLLDEGHMATGYVVEGDDKVCVIDTMNGFTDIKSYIRKFTDKPIVVVNTHGHPDHIFGNVYFDEAYLHPKDLELAESFVTSPDFAAACEKYGLVMPPFKPIREGDVIDLGGKTLEVYELPGHTAGGIVLLLKEDRILFTGDAINHHFWMQISSKILTASCSSKRRLTLFCTVTREILTTSLLSDACARALSRSWKARPLMTGLTTGSEALRSSTISRLRKAKSTASTRTA